MKPEKTSEQDNRPVIYSFTGPFDEEHIQAFLAEHINFGDVVSVALTPPQERDPDVRRPEILATVSGTSREQDTKALYSVYSEHELRELVKGHLNGNTLPKISESALLQQITLQTLQTLSKKAEQLVAGHPVEVSVKLSRPAGPRVGTGFAPLPTPPLSGNSLN